MYKKILAAILGMIVVAVAAVLMVRWLANRESAGPMANRPKTENQPLTGSQLPKAASPGIQTWTGVLGLGQTATLQVGQNIYSLYISQGDGTAAVLTQQGYKTGDRVNVTGKLNNTVIEALGVGKVK